MIGYMTRHKLISKPLLGNGMVMNKTRVNITTDPSGKMLYNWDSLSRLVMKMLSKFEILKQNFA